MSDLLRMDYINSLPQPFLAELIDGWSWEVYDIEVGTGLVRINVMGKLDVIDIGEILKFIDGDGCEHVPDTFYSDYKE